MGSVAAISNSLEFSSFRFEGSLQVRTFKYQQLVPSFQSESLHNLVVVGTRPCPVTVYHSLRQAEKEITLSSGRWSVLKRYPHRGGNSRANGITILLVRRLHSDYLD